MAGRDTQLKIIIDAQDRTKGALGSVNRQLGETTATASRFTSTLKTTAAVAASALGAAVFSIGTIGVTTAAQLETARVGLLTLLGDAEKADKTIERLKKEAARTPFELVGLSQATQLLSSVTKDGQKSIDILLDVGEALAAMGKGQSELDRIIVNLQQVAAVGKASMVDIKQFAFAGIPIFEMLEEHFGKTGVKAVNDHSEAITKNGARLEKLQQQLKVAKERQEDFTKKTSDATRMANRFQIKNLTKEIASIEAEMSGLVATNGQVTTSFVSVEDAITNGEVTFELLTELFDKANDSGGRFFNAFKNQSGTFNQALANLKDSFALFAADVVTQTGLFKGLTNVMMQASDFLGNYKTRIEELKTSVSNLLLDLDAKTGLITLFKEAWANVSHMWNTQLKPALLELWQALQPYKPFLDAFVQILGATLVVSVAGLIHTLGILAVVLGQILTWGTQVATFYANTFIKVWNAVTDAIATVTRAVDNLIEKLERAWSWANKVVDKVGGKIAGGINKVVGVDDAVISPSGQVVSTHPDDWLIATKNPATLGGGGITVNINGGTYLSEDSAERIGDLLMQRLKLSNAL